MLNSLTRFRWPGLNLKTEWLGPSIEAKDILLFTRFLSTLITAGVPIGQALDLIASEQENALMQEKVVSIRDSVAKGKSLSESFAQFPKIFDALYCSLIKAGEQSGTLDKLLKRLADYLEKTETLQRKIKKALTYPSLIVIVTLGVSYILLYFVLPQFQFIVNSKVLKPAYLTETLFQLSHFLHSHFLIIFILLSLLITLTRLEKINKWLLKITGLGPLLRKGMISRYARTLSIILDAGIPLKEAMSLMVQMKGTLVYRRAIRRIGKAVNGGNPLSVALGKAQLFPSTVVEMVSIGESSGNLAEMLNQVADYYQERVSSMVERFSAYLEPLLMVVLGGILGTFVFSLYGPVFQG